MGFTFNGIRKEYIVLLSSERRPAFAPIKRNFLSISGKPGALLESTDVEARVLNEPILIDKGLSGFDDIEKLKEDLAAWFFTENPVPLIFDDDPEKTYFAVVDGSLDIEDTVNYGRGIVTFICPDPYKYGSEKEVAFSNAASFLVEGSAETLPEIEVTLKADTTFLAVSNGEEINIIGNPVKQDETPFEAETPKLIHGANTLTGWTVSSGPSLEGADLTGTLKTDGSKFYTDDYGTSMNWHGPAMKTSLPSAIQDFRFDTGFNMRKTGYNQAGHVSTALLDANNRIVAHIMMTKHFGGLDKLSGRIRAGSGSLGHDVLREGLADYLGVFEGVIRVIRKGNQWIAQVFYLKNGVFLPPVTHSWTDTEGIASAPVTQVQVRLLQRAAFPVVEQKIADIHVYQLNDPAEGQVPIIGRAGDKVIFDHINDRILLNGQDITSEKAFIGEYFSLNPGQNTLVTEPMDTTEMTKARWRERWR